MFCVVYPLIIFIAIVDLLSIDILLNVFVLYSTY